MENQHVYDVCVYACVAIVVKEWKVTFFIKLSNNKQNHEDSPNGTLQKTL